MCRKNQLCGVGLLGFGLGLLVASFLESALFCGCLGLLGMAVGVVIFQKKLKHTLVQDRIYCITHGK